MNAVKHMLTLWNGIKKLIGGILICLIHAYRYIVSPVIHTLAPGSGCRFQPTCSEYALIALRQHGPVYGSWLAIKRLAKCHPWGSHGYDPVPDGCSCTKRTDAQHPSSFEPSSATDGRLKDI
jgi:putative membrane protein insertion efficiency factor